MKIYPKETKIYFINLPEHKEREINFRQRMLEHGFDENMLERIEGIRIEGIPQDDVYIGCFHSQLKTLKKAASSGEFPFMILEDDAEINYIPDSIEVPQNSDVVYVGISSWGFSPSPDGNLAEFNRIITDRVSSDVVKIFNMLSSHAILYTNKEYVDSLIEDLENNLNGNQQRSSSSDVPLKYYGGNLLPCDIIMANKQYHNNAYALRNPIFYQGDKHQYCTLIKI